MQHNLDRDDLAEVWRNAQHRRAEDIGSWLRCFFERRRQLESIDTEARYHQQGEATLLR